MSNSQKCIFGSAADKLSGINLADFTVNNAPRISKMPSPGRIETVASKQPLVVDAVTKQKKVRPVYERDFTPELDGF